jgi:hypothetical protein
VPSIHLVERLGNLERVDDALNEWESGYWSVGEEVAGRLVGGRIYLHEHQSDPSHFGGEILSFRIHAAGPYAGRVVFRFRPAPAFKNVKASRGGWGNEKKIVW